MSPYVARLVALIESWEKAYLPPSAMIVLRDARLKLVEQDERIADLLIEVAELNDRILAPSTLSALDIPDKEQEKETTDEQPPAKPRARKTKGEPS